MAAAEMHLAATDRAKEKAGQGWSLLSDELRQALVAKEALPIIAQNEDVPGYDRVSHLADFVLAGWRRNPPLGTTMADTDPNPTLEQQLAAERERNRELEAQCERLAALAEGCFSDVRLLGAGPRKGEGFGFDLTGGPIPYIAEYLVQMLGYRDGDGTSPSNYVEIEVSHHEFGPMTMTLQRRSGLTPHQKAQGAIERTERLQNDLNHANQRIAELEAKIPVIEGAPVALEQARYMLRDYAAKGGAPGRMPDILREIGDVLRDRASTSGNPPSAS